MRKHSSLNAKRSNSVVILKVIRVISKLVKGDLYPLGKGSYRYINPNPNSNRSAKVHIAILTLTLIKHR